MSNRPALERRAVQPAAWLSLLAAVSLFWPAGGSSAQPTVLEHRATPCAVSSIQVGETQKGELDERDCLLPRLGGRFFADRYQFIGTVGQQVVVVAQSAMFQPFLLLIREADDEEAARAGPVGFVARIPVGAGFFALPADGTYVIEVTSNAAEKTGPYTIAMGGAASPYRVFGHVAEGGLGGVALPNVTLEFSRVGGTGAVPGPVQTDALGSWSQHGFEPGTTYRVTPSRARYVFAPGSQDFNATTELLFSGTDIRCDAFMPTRIQTGETKHGVLEDGDCLSPQLVGASFADRYWFDGAAGQHVVVVAQSAAFRPFLVLNHQADDRELARAGPVGPTTRLPVEAGFLALPADGAYVIEVTSNAANKTGPYTVTLGGETTPFEGYGRVTEGRLGGEGLAGVTLTFSRAEGTGGVPESVETDANGDWSQSGFEPGTTYRATPSKEGYVFSPRFLDFGTTKELLIVGTLGQCDASAVAPIHLGEARQGTLEQTDCLLPQLGGQAFADKYRFSGVAGQRVVVVAQQSAFRPFVVLRRETDDRELARAGPVGSVARLPVGAGFFELPTGGAYVIEVTSNGVDEVGPYTVMVGAPCGDTALARGEGCDDHNPCTTDSCDRSGVCVYTPSAGSCEDGDACSTGDTCVDGRCVGGPPLDCDDDNPCTEDACDGVKGCVYGHNAAPCDDGNACTTADACADGHCAGGLPLNCDDDDACTADGCDPRGGCKHTDNTERCDDGNVCTDDTCDRAAGCVHTNNAAPCDDGSACTTADACADGRCIGGLVRACDDGNVCTDDTCDVATGCVHTNNILPCDDGNACTVVDVCMDGRCVGSPSPGCDDGDVCTDDSCDTAVGCVYTSNTAPCDDGNACTTGDTCKNGGCIGGPPPDCDDDNICTDDACDTLRGCVHTNNGVSCDDGNACTTNDTCGGGRCVGGERLHCDDGNVCTDDGCDAARGCVHADNTAPCDDGNACTTADACASGRCVGGRPPSCDDGNICTDDACDAARGCVHTDNTASCDDGNACTTADACASGRCVGGPPAQCHDGNVCTDDACDTARGCLHTDNTASCDDGNACTTADTCTGGRCVGGPPAQCDDGNVCTDDACDAARGCVHTDNTASCDDGNACTTADACTGGRCVGGPPAQCGDGNVCTDDACDAARGCVHPGNTASCDDGNACTEGDTCTGGRCVGGEPPSCDDGNVCTDDGCDAARGCVHASNAAPCDDGNACTEGDTCAGGRCSGGPPAQCDDGNVCTDDGCDRSSGCMHSNNAAHCEDGNACTTDDACADGRCVGGPPLDCDDGNICTNDGCDGTSGCVHSNNTAPCEDGDACTTTDTCRGGRCRGGPARDCRDQDLCTDDGCDPASGCTHTLNTDCAMVCGDLATAPCSVTVSSLRRRFSDLQAAIDAATNGATITVEGVCPGPVRISRRRGLTVQGAPPTASGCPQDGLGPNALRSTLKGGGKVLEVRESENIAIRFLNIVDGEKAGLQFSEVDGSRAECNCMARNGTAGLSIAVGRANELRMNLITLNVGCGARLRDATENAVVKNTVRENRGAGVLMRDAHRNTLQDNVIERNAADGITLHYSDRNVLRENAVRGNAEDGVDLKAADRNQMIGNDVRRNGTRRGRDSGIEFEESRKNVCRDNIIKENADGLVDQVRCEPGAKQNRGSNVSQECS